MVYHLLPPSELKILDFLVDVDQGLTCLRRKKQNYSADFSSVKV